MIHFLSRATALGIVTVVSFLSVGLLGAPQVRAEEAGSGSSSADASASASASGSSTDRPLTTIVVTAERLDASRSGIETLTGASTYTITSEAISAQPGGENNPMNQVLLQAPSVVQDSFGQLHVRGDHNDLQYRINGIILPEGTSVFSQTLSPRLVSSLSLITGALPAEYGLRTAGIIDIKTNSGLRDGGGEVSVYGGSHDTFQPAAEYGGSSGNFSYYVLSSYNQNNLGIESPDGSANPLHDHSTQGQAFGYFENIINSENRLALIVGLANDHFEIPNQRGLQPPDPPGYVVNGQSEFLSDNLNENQHELAEYAILSWQHSAGGFDWQTAVSVRYTSLHFAPDWTGDLLYNGIAQDAFKSDTAIGWQTDASYKIATTHTVRFGLYFQHDSATTETTSSVLPVDANGMQTSDVPLSILDNGKQSQEISSAYLQDEWQALAPLTIHYGVRFDHYSAYSSGSLVGPRLNFVWNLGSGTTVHGGYSRYFTPPPFELIASTSITKFSGTTGLLPGSVIEDSPPIAEKANYYDLGVQQKLMDNALTLGIDTYYEQAQHLIDEGQFGAPIILTPFNYRYGLIGGVELTANYSVQNFSTYANISWQAAHGKQVESSQFNFGQDDLNYIADNYIHLDHEGRVAASGGASYLWKDTRFSANFIFGSGLRTDEELPDGSTIPNGGHLPSYAQINLGLSHAFRLAGSSTLTARFDVINVTDKTYEIRDGGGIGVFASQYGPRRGFFGGLAWAF